MLKKITSSFLAVLSVTLLLPPFVNTVYAESSGVCGNGVTYSFEQSTGTLTISGNGDMKNYSWGNGAPWNSYASSIKSVTIENGVTYIGNFAFYGCSGLTGPLTIPSSVTEIGSEAFSGCRGLSSVTIENGVTEIGFRAFSDCSGLTSITIPNSVTEIGISAFEYCSGLTGSLTIPSGVTEIKSKAFRGCRGLTSITIPNSVTKIGDYAFSSCRGLTSITIPNSVTKIGDYAFSSCSGLTSITIPFGVDSISCGTFFGCSGLTSITIPSRVTEISFYAFSGCSSLTSITIPSSVIVIGQYAFKGCSGLEKIYVDRYNKNYKSIDGILFSKDGTQLFKYPAGKEGTSYTIPENVTDMVDGVFSDCSRLTSITIPKSMTYICDEAFRGCSGLTSITIPSSVDFIGNGAFEGCSGLTSITIPSGVTDIGNRAFSGCSGLKGSLTIPDSVTEIGDRTFSGCSGLTSITIPSRVTSIGSYAFYDCSGLTSITIPGSVREIGQNAFEGCSGLTSITIPDSVTEIKPAAFKGCSGLKTIFYTKFAVPENPGSANLIKYKVDSDDNGIKNVTLTAMSSTEHTSLSCNAMGAGYRIVGVGWSIADKLTLNHNYDDKVEAKEPTYLEDGVNTYTCKSCNETRTEVIPKLTHDDPNAGVQYWGEKRSYNGYEMYVDSEGKTSALVTGNERIFLREESYDSAAWYILDNTSGEFEAGSRFWVKWLNIKENPEEFKKYFESLDQSIRDRIDSNRVWIFLIGVTKPDGTTEYKTFSKEIPLYIQMGTDWDYQDIRSAYILESEDEEVHASYLNMEYPEGNAEFAKLSLKHFSPYAIYDYLTDEEKAELENTAVSEKTDQVNTGDNIKNKVLILLSIMISTGLFLEICLKKRIKL